MGNEKKKDKRSEKSYQHLVTMGKWIDGSMGKFQERSNEFWCLYHFIANVEFDQLYAEISFYLFNPIRVNILTLLHDWFDVGIPTFKNPERHTKVTLIEEHVAEHLLNAEHVSLLFIIVNA